MEIHVLSIMAILTEWVYPIFLFVFGLGAVVFVHELGHFLVAKAVGIKVERFAIGFGPRVCGYRGKETDYSLMLLPLGGYVKMLGQEDFAPLKEGEQPDPRSYGSKSVGARFAVISAGVIMNVIFAAILFVIIGMVGMPVEAPVVGGTLPGYPAAAAEITWVDEAGRPIDTESPNYPADQPTKIMPGDRMISIDGEGLMLRLLGKEVVRFRRVLIQAALSDVDDKYTLGIQRTVGDRKLLGRTTLGVKMASAVAGTRGEIPAFGIRPAASTTLVRADGYAPDNEDILQDNDRIISVNGRKIEHYWDITELEETLAPGPVEMTVERTVDGKLSEVKLPKFQPMVYSTKVFYLKDGEIVRGKAQGHNDDKGVITLLMGEGKGQFKRKVAISNLANTHYSRDTGLTKEQLDVLGMIPRVRIGAVSEGSPADKADLQAGDIIVRYGVHQGPTHLKLKELNKKFAADGADIVVMRDGKVLPPVKIRPEGNKALLGVIVAIDMDNLVVGGVRENSPAADMELRSGDVVEKVNGQEVNTWSGLIAALSELKGKDVTLTVRRGSNSTDNIIPELSPIIFDRSDYSISLKSEPWRYKSLLDPKVSRGPLSALVWGGKETMFFITTSYATLRSLIKGTVSTKDVSGPVGIGAIAIKAGRKGMVDFAYFMAMISVSLAVINFLPFPVVDGGHAMFLIMEKIRGKPLSIGVMNVVQLIGLAMILLVFVLVTWQDIARLLGA